MARRNRVAKCGTAICQPSTLSEPAAILIGTAACVESEPDLASVAPSTGIRFLADGEAEGFTRAETTRSFVFPVDHGGHPDYRTEWWYFTGNVFGANERHYGFEVTFFRVALTPTAPQSVSSWATNQFWMATDLNRCSGITVVILVPSRVVRLQARR